MEGTHERTLKTYVLGLEDEPIHEGLSHNYLIVIILNASY